MKNFSERVLHRRLELGLTQTQVAKIAGLKQSDVSKIERGLISQTTKMLGLAKALRCRPEWLDSGNGLVDAVEASQMPMQAMESPAPYAPVLMQQYDHWTLAAIGLMMGLKPYQREGAVAALKTYIGNLSPLPQPDGQNLRMAG